MRKENVKMFWQVIRLIMDKETFGLTTIDSYRISCKIVSDSLKGTITGSAVSQEFSEGGLTFFRGG